MLPTRAWQLSLGGLLVLLPCIRGRILSEFLKVLGLLFLLSAIFLIDPDAPYPAISALFPTIGAVLLIWPAERDTVVAELFSLAPLRYFGRISYSLYLWHWPPMVMYLTWNLSNSLSVLESTFLFLFAWCAAHLTWQFVEEPFRRNRFPDGKLLISSIFGVCIGAMMSWILVVTDGVPTRITVAGQELSTRMQREITAFRPVQCDFRDLIKDNAECLTLSTDDYHLLLMGDSHANHLLSALQDFFPSVKISTITRSGCRPVVGSVGRAECVKMYETFFRDVLPNYHFDAIVLSARWRNGQHENVGKTVDLLSQFSERLIVFGQTVEYDHPLPEILMASYLPRRSSDVQSFMSSWPEIVDLDYQMEQQLSTRPAEYHSMIDTICPGNECTVFTPSGMPLVWDYGHFNASGAKLIIDRLKDMKGFSLP